MQRNDLMWVQFSSLALCIALTTALLPACSGGGGGDSCNSLVNQEAGNEVACVEEESSEEEINFELSRLDDRREDGEGTPLEEILVELAACEGENLGCAEETNPF